MIRSNCMRKWQRVRNNIRELSKKSRRKIAKNKRYTYSSYPIGLIPIKTIPSNKLKIIPWHNNRNRTSRRSTIKMVTQLHREKMWCCCCVYRIPDPSYPSHSCWEFRAWGRDRCGKSEDYWVYWGFRFAGEDYEGQNTSKRARHILLMF